jgi:hypothetical protein
VLTHPGHRQAGAHQRQCDADGGQDADLAQSPKPYL